MLSRLYFASQAQTKNTPLKSSRFFTLNHTKILSAKEYKQALLGIILIFSICMSTQMCIRDSRGGGLGLMIMVLCGFSVYMTHLGANDVVVKLVSKPLKNIRSPYILMVFRCV